MKVYWTDRAKRRLKLIEEYIAQGASESLSEQSAESLPAPARSVSFHNQDVKFLNMIILKYGKFWSVHTASFIEFGLIG